jgi:cation diffusion facilitator family transporter
MSTEPQPLRAVLISRWQLNRGQRIVLLGLISNILLAGIQVLAGWWGQSRAVLADGVHSGSDILISVMVLISLGVARKPPDESHPFGYGKAESIAAFLVGLVIGGAGLTLVYQSMDAILSGVKTVPSVLPLAVACISIAVKISLYRVTSRVARELDSPGVLAAAQEYLSCVACSSSAAAGIIGARFGFPIADAIAGLVVAGFVVRMAGQTIWTSTRDLMDAALPAHEVRALRSLAEDVEGVRNVSSVRTRRTGSRRLVELDIDIDADLIVEEADRVASQVHTRVAGQMDPADDVRVFVAPTKHEEAERQAREATIRKIVQFQTDRFLSFHGPHITRLGRDTCADLVIVMPKTSSMEDAYALCADLERDVRKRYPDMELIVRLRTTK